MDDTLAGLLGERAARDPGGIHSRFNGVPLTFAALDRQASAFAAAIRSRGLAPGDRVAVMLRSTAAHLTVIFGLAKAGLVWVPINVRQVGDGLTHLLVHSQPKLLVVESDLVETCARALGPSARLDTLVSSNEDEDAPLQTALCSDEGYDGQVFSPESMAAIMYTSGTTGPPKGVIVSNRMLRLAAEAVGLVAVARANDVFFVWEAWHHIGGAQLLMLPMTHGIELAMAERFSASRFWQQVEAARATHIHFLGGILQILMKQPAGPHDRSHRVRIAWGGGCAPTVWRPFEERFGVEIHECYGMTEGSSISTINTAGFVGSVGRRVPWFTVAVVDKAGRPAAESERGEIVLRATVPGALFTGYFNDPAATATMLRDGALYTGDLGSLDGEGWLTFLGRVTDGARCRGENVSAWEVEHVAASHPAVEDCAMIGVAADIGEQDIKLFVKARDGFRVDPADLSVWLGSRLASYQNPRYICVVEDFARTASQRIIKQALRERSDDCWDRDAPQPN